MNIETAKEISDKLAKVCAQLQGVYDALAELEMDKDSTCEIRIGDSCVDIDKLELRDFLNRETNRLEYRADGIVRNVLTK